MRFIQVHDGDHAGSHGAPIKGKPGWTRDATCWINLEQVVSFDISDLGGGSEYEPDGNWLTVSMITTNGKLYFSPVEFHTVQQALDWVLKSKAAHNMTDDSNKAYPSEKNPGQGWSPMPWAGAHQEQKPKLEVTMKDGQLVDAMKFINDPALKETLQGLTPEQLTDMILGMLKAEQGETHQHWSVEVPEAPFVFYIVTRMHVPTGESELREVTVASMIRQAEVVRVLQDNMEHINQMNVYRVRTIRADTGMFQPEDDGGDEDLGGPVTAHVG